MQRSEKEVKREEEKLRFLKEFGVVLCVKCGCCVAPGVVKGHFRDGKMHLGVKGKEINEIVAWMGGLDGLAMKVQDVKYPKPECVGVDGLEVFLGGFICGWKKMGEDGEELAVVGEEENEEEEREGEGEGEGGEIGEGCGFVCGSDHGMRKHGKTEHGWVSGVGRGRVGRGVVREKKFWEGGVKFQQFFKLSSWNVSFEVRRGGEGEGGSDENEDGNEDENVNGKGGSDWRERLKRMMLEKKDENWKKLRDGRVDDQIGRVDVDD